MSRLGLGLGLAWTAVVAAAEACVGSCPADRSSPGGGGEVVTEPTKEPAGARPRAGETPEDPYFAEERARMVDLVRRYGVQDERVLDALARVPRHLFLPTSLRRSAYDDGPLPIGHGQTISQPYIVARMTELARAGKGERALDIGTGSGYQAAVLAEVVDRVWSIEIVCPLADQARTRLAELGYTEVEVRCGDGYRGWPEHAPFDVIILAAAAPEIPKPLVDQLAPGGRLVLPVGPSGGVQELRVLEKASDGSIRTFSDGQVRFVPMTGEAQEK